MGDTDKPVRTVRLCHHCHAPQSEPCHVGILTGSGHCTLEHWEECTLQKEEGYDKNKKWWTGCPAGLESDKDDLDSTQEDDLQDTAKNSLDSSWLDGDEEIKLATQALPSSVKEAAELLSKSNGLDIDETGDDTDGEEDRLYAEEVQALKRRVEEQAKQIEDDRLLALKTAQKEKKRSDRMKQRAELERQREELLQREKLLQQEAAVRVRASRLTQSAPRSSTANASSSAKEAAARKLQAKAASHAARQQKTAADHQRNQNVSLMNIAGIRQLPGMTQEVENHLTGFQSIIPPLARDPTASTNGGQFQPPGVLTSGSMLSHPQAGGFSVATGYVYVAELGQLVPTVSSMAHVGATSGGQGQKMVSFPEQALSESEVSADEDCPVSPAPGNRLVWRRDSQGRKFCEEKAVRDRSPEVIETWVKRADGRIYKEKMTKTRTMNSLVTPKSASVFADHRPAATVRGQGKTFASGQVYSEERLPTFVAGEDRGGKETSVPSLVKCARLCPVAWTDKITSDQLNPIIWSWAYIAELLATRTGQAQDLPVGELEARLQHFLNVMEVTLQTSTKSDYMGDSWKVGRLYHSKVQAKMDQGRTTWCKMMDKWESATLPHELMAAQQELAPKLVKKQKENEKLKGGDSKPPPCSTWNTWETKGTCKWESENPGQKCNRVHECTYCKTKKFKQVHHQRLFCPKRIDAGVD